MTRVVRFSEYGGPEVLKIEEEDLGRPGPGEVRVKISAFALNRSETFFRQGFHPIKPVFPSRIGYEAAGYVEAIGEGVTSVSVGDRVGTLPVMEVNRYGTYAEAMRIPARLLVKNPKRLDDIRAAALWTSYMTAYGALVELVTIAKSDFVLCTAASSSVATAAIQILDLLGARTIAVTRSRKKADAIRALGVHDVIVAQEEDLVDRVGEITGGTGVRFVFDPIGGPDFPKLVEATAPYGSIILYGATHPEPTPLPVMAAVGRNLSILGYAMLLDDKPDRNERAIEYIRRNVDAGHFKPVVGETFKFDEVRDAVRFLDSMDQMGKIVVVN